MKSFRGPDLASHVPSRTTFTKRNRQTVSVWLPGGKKRNSFLCFKTCYYFGFFGSCTAVPLLFNFLETLSTRQSSIFSKPFYPLNWYIEFETLLFCSIHWRGSYFLQQQLEKLCTDNFAKYYLHLPLYGLEIRKNFWHFIFANSEAEKLNFDEEKLKVSNFSHRIRSRIKNLMTR